MDVDEKLAEEIRRRVGEGPLPCAIAFEIAEKLGIAPAQVGQAANELAVKITDCQLGCFGKGRK